MPSKEQFLRVIVRWDVCFLEAVYQECLERKLTIRGIPFVAQQPLQLTYKGEALRQIYQPERN